MPSLHVMESTIISRLAKCLVGKKRKKNISERHIDLCLSGYIQIYLLLQGTLEIHKKTKSHTPVNIFKN